MREFSIRVWDRTGEEKFLQFYSCVAGDFELRVKDVAVFTYYRYAKPRSRSKIVRERELWIIQNVTIGQCFFPMGSPPYY